MALTQAEILGVFSQVGAVKNSDQLLLITGNVDGTVSATKITAELLRAYLNKGFELTIDDEGYLYIGGVKQDTKVAGITPQITRDGDTIYVSLDNGETRSVLFSLSELTASSVVVQTKASVKIHPNVLNVWDDPVSALSIEFLSGLPNVENEYRIQFTCPPENGTALTLPEGIRWANDDVIEPEASMTYQISIENNLAVYTEW